MATRYSIPNMIQRWVDGFRASRRRKLGERLMNELPPSLQRDIGWDPTAPLRRR